MDAARARRWLLPVIYLGFISLGLPDGTLGVAWPQMHGSLALPIGLAGPLMLVVTLLSAGSSFMSGRVTRRFSEGPVVMVSCALTGGALLMVGHAQHVGWLFLAALPLGLGAGSVDAGLNSYVARHYSGRHMNWLHACWGVGATVGPLVMAQAVGLPDGWRTGYLIIGATQLVLAGVFLSTLTWWKAVPTRSHGGVAEGAGAAAAVRKPSLGANSEAGWISAALFAVYVAIELSAGLWLATFPVKERQASAGLAGLAVSLYFGAITGGRILSGFLVERVGNRRMVAGGTWVALAGALMLCTGVSMPLLLVAVVVMGLGFAPIYPGLMHEVPTRFAPEAVGVVIGRQAGAAYLGGALLPALSGWWVQTSGPFTVMVVVAAGAVVLVALVQRLNRLT